MPDVPLNLLEQLREAQHQQQQLRAEITSLRERLAIAEHAARDAWRFARALLRRPAPRS